MPMRDTDDLACRSRSTRAGSADPRAFHGSSLKLPTLTESYLCHANRFNASFGIVGDNMKRCRRFEIAHRAERKVTIHASRCCWIRKR